jgi:rhodanese-related sulfurtransferase
MGLQGVQFIDVREPWEFEEANLGPQFKLLPLSEANKWCEAPACIVHDLRRDYSLFFK